LGKHRAETRPKPTIRKIQVGERENLTEVAFIECNLSLWGERLEALEPGNRLCLTGPVVGADLTLPRPVAEGIGESVRLGDGRHCKKKILRGKV
jgi:hypothetical protein